MKPDLYLYSRIIAHLEYLTTYDEFGSTRSRDVGTIAALAIELNTVGIVPRRGYWTTKSLECFLPRIKDRYPPEEIREACDCRFVGHSTWEYLCGSTAAELKTPRPLTISQKEPEYPSAPVTRYKAMDGEIWKQYEEKDLFREAAAIKRSAKAKNYSDRVSRNLVVA